MKNIAITFAVILLTALESTAQFKLSGRIQNIKGQDSIVLNIPFIYGSYPENDIKIPVKTVGSFSYTADVKEQRFVSFQYKNSSFTLLLRPGKALSLTLDSAGKVIHMTGNAATENQALYDARLNEVPFFLKDENKNNQFSKMSFNELQEKLVKPWFAERDEKLRTVVASNLPVNDKRLIESEIRYNALIQLNYFAHGVIYADKKLINKFINANFQGIKNDPDFLPPGPLYYYFTESYMNYMDGKIFSEYPPTDKRSHTPFYQIYHISLDSAMKLVKDYGSCYIRWILYKQYFKSSVAEQYLAQAIWKECREKDISHIRPLMHEFEKNFPSSRYMLALRTKVAIIEDFNKQNLSLKNIEVFNGYEKTSSIYDVINTLKGKVIYLDVWGTWCGPCKKELLYNPRLKEYFKDKDIVFVYLDMDEDDRDAEWKKFIRVNGITGIHLRKNNLDIQKFWNELLPSANQRYYPSYFIFDRSGKLVQADTKPPSDGNALYTELEKYL